ncbi:MAG: hypothetical protein ACOC1F_01835 [Myxococcota bacterium]
MKHALTNGRTMSVSTALLLMWSLASCGGDESRPSGIGTCPGPGCPSQEAGAEASVEAGIDAANDAQDDAALDTTSDAYDGPTGTLQGDVFISNLPQLPTERTDQFPLYYPAAISVWANGQEYSAGVASDSGYTLDEIPAGSHFVVVRDIDDKNGLVDTGMVVDIPEGTGGHDFPALALPAFVVVYGGLSQPVYRNPMLAQMVISFETCAEQGGERLAGVVLEAPAGAEAVIVNDGSAWVSDPSAATGSNGIAFVANVPAQPLPGETVALSYSMNGEVFPIPPFPVFQGGATRVVVVHPC